MAWEFDNNTALQNDNEPQWELEGTKPVTQSVMDDRDGQVYNVPLAYDGVDTRFAIDTQHKGADKGSFFGKVLMDVSKMTTALTTSNMLSKMLPDNISFESAKDLARGLVGSAEGFVDNKLVEATDLRQKQRIAAGKTYQMSAGDPLRDMAFDWDMPTEEEQEEAKKLVETAQKIRDANKKWWNDTKEAIKPEETMDETDKFIEALGDGAGSMLISMGSMLPFKSATVGAALIASEYGKMAGNQFFDEAVKNGMDFDMAYTLALGRGGIEGGIELVADTTLAKIANLKAIQDISNRIISTGLIKAAQSKLGKSAMQKIGTRHANSVFGAAIKGLGSEAGTEGLQQSLGMFYDNASGIADYSLDQILGETLFASVIGGITGGLGAGGGTLVYNRQVVDTNERIKKVLQEQTPDLTAEETQTMADALQEMLYQESTGYMNELNNVMKKELAPDARQEGLTPEQLTAETRKLLKEKYKMSDEDINKTIQSALSIIDARNQFNETYSAAFEALTNQGRKAAYADAEARVFASRVLAVARAEGVQAKDVVDRMGLQFKKTAWNETDIEAQSKPVVEFNAVTFEDTKSQEAVKSAFLSNGFSEKAADDAIANLQKVVDFAKQLGQESDRLREQNERSEYIEQRPTEDVSKYESEGMSLAVASGKKTLGMVPRVSVFVKNGDYQYNIDFGTTCTRREPLEAAVKIMIDMGKAGNLGLSQINNIKDILGKHGFTKPCVLCFVEGKRTYELISANRLSRQWNVVLKSIGVEDAKVIGTERKLTDEMIKRLKEISQGDGYEKYVDKKYRDKNEKDPVGLTQARAKAISKIMIDEYERTGKSTLVNRMRPDMLMNSRGTDYLFRKYITDAPTLKGLIAARDGAGTPKPHTSYPVYDTRSWKEIFDLKKDVKKEVKHLFDIGGVRLQSFSDFNEYMVIDYLQAMLDMAARGLPAHSYTKVTSFVELFGEMLNINMSLIGEPAKGVSAEYDGLRPAKEGDKVVLEDENGKWTYNWATESFDPEKAFQLRKEERFNGKVGTVGIGISDKQILAMLNDPEIDMIIPFHKSGIQDHVLISAGLKRADGTEVKDYSDFQNTKKPKGFKEDYLFNEHMQKIGDAKDVAADYLSWCKTKKCKPKFEQFSKHENYYKLLEDFRSYDNNGDPVVQKAVEFKTGENFNEMLANAIKDRDDVVGAISKIQNNEALMRDLEEAVRYYHLDGELKKVMLNKIEKALGGKEHLKVLSQEDMLEELSKTNPKETQEFRDGKGVLYGFAKGGQIFLNVQGFNANTPVHEYSHIWARVVQSTNKNLWEKGVSLLEQTDKWKELEGKEQYKELRKNKDMFASEVFAHIVGENNEEIARYFQDPDAPEYKNKSLKSKILQFIKDVFSHIRSMFDPKFKLTEVKEAKDFATMALLDLYDDGRAAELAKTVKAMRKKGEFLQESQGDFLFQSAFAGSRVDYDKSNPQGPRGAYRNSIIYLFENADASTVIHELGHFFLDDMQKFADNETTKRQLEAIYKYVGSTDGNLTIEQHEYFANSFELYLLEGRAPNKTLEKVFWNFRKWISRIWSEIKRLSGINLTPEIRKVFDEMLGGRGLDFAMQMSGARIAEALESGTIPPNVIAKAIELLETGKMSRADMDDLIARMKTGELKRKDFNQELKKFENSNVKHGERLNPFDKVKYKEALARGNFSKKDVLEKINRLLKWTEPRSQNGKVVGRFSNLKMNQEFDHIRELMNMDKAQAKEKLNENIKLINAMIRGEVAIKEKDRSPDDQVGEMERLVFDNKILTIRLNKANASLLLDVYNAISDSYNMGRLTTAITGEARRARKNRLVNEAVHVLTADGEVDWRRERSKLKQFVNQLGTSQMSWQGILDILSMNDKTSKTGRSLLVQNLDVFDAQQKEAQGLAEDGEKASRFMEKKLKGVGNAAISVSRYVNSKLDKKFTIQWGANKKTFTKDQLLDIYMKSKDDETRKMMAEDPILQYNERFLSEVNEILTAEDRAIAEALFEFYDDNYAKINAFYEEKYGTSLGKRAFYSPRSMDRGGVNVDSGDLASYAGFSGIKERKAKAGAVKIKGAFQVLQDYIVNSNHWIAWSDKLIDINAVMGDVEVKNIIRNLFGEDMEKRIGYEVSRMASNDKFQKSWFSVNWVKKIRSNYAIAALATKPSLMIKQLTSFPAYWEHMSTAEFMSGLADFAIHMKEAVETLGNTTLMKTRDVNIIKDFEELSKSELFKSGSTKVKLREFMMANIKLGDRGAIYVGGWALYKAELKKNLAKGMSEEKAKALALEKFERVTDETQQSGRLSQQSYWQSNPFLRMFTMFQSSQNQYLRKEINAIRGLATGRMDKKQAAKTLFIFHILLPCFFQYVSDGFDWDEEAQLRAALLGSLNGIFILNGILERGLDYVLGTADAWKATSTALSDVLPYWGSGEDLAKFFINLAEGDIDLEDYVEVIRAFGKPVGELTGIPVKYILDVIQNFGSYAEEGEVKKEVLLWLGWTPYALRDKEED